MIETAIKENDAEDGKHKAKKTLALLIAGVITVVIVIAWLFLFTARAKKTMLETREDRGAFFSSVKERYNTLLGSAKEAKESFGGLISESFKVNEMPAENDGEVNTENFEGNQ